MWGLLRWLLQVLGDIDTIRWVLQWKWVGVGLSAVIGLALGAWAWLVRIPGPFVVLILFGGFGMTLGILLLLVLIIDQIRIRQRKVSLMLERGGVYESVGEEPIEMPWGQEIELHLALYNPSRLPLANVHYRIWSGDGLQLRSVGRPELASDDHDPTILRGRIQGPIRWKDNFGAGRIRFSVPQNAAIYTMRYVISLEDVGAISGRFRIRVIP